MILAADVGGTKIHLGLFLARGKRLEKVSEVLLATQRVTSLADELQAFAEDRRVRTCVLGVAGPIVAGRVRGANLPWEIDAVAISQALGAPVEMLNDVETSGWGLAEIGSEDLITLQEGTARRDTNRALISPGTGLGQSVLFFDGDVHRPVPSEGGHADFSPRTDEEMELYRYLRQLYGRVSWERVVSGPGIVNIFLWLRESGQVTHDARFEVHPGDPEAPALISSAALEGASVICRETMRIWICAFGAEAGNLALRGMAVGGVYLGGGIPARIAPLLQGGEFLHAFRDKTPYADLLAQIPVFIVASEETSLLGAARLAATARRRRA